MIIMKTVTNIICDFLCAIVSESSDSVYYEACSCGDGVYIAFYYSEELCTNFIKLLVSRGVECIVSFDGLYYRYRIVLNFY